MFLGAPTRLDSQFYLGYNMLLNMFFHGFSIQTRNFFLHYFAKIFFYKNWCRIFIPLYSSIRIDADFLFDYILLFSNIACASSGDVPGCAYPPRLAILPRVQHAAQHVKVGGCGAELSDRAKLLAVPERQGRKSFDVGHLFPIHFSAFLALIFWVIVDTSVKVDFLMSCQSPLRTFVRTALPSSSPSMSRWLNVGS